MTKKVKKSLFGLIGETLDISVETVFFVQTTLSCILLLANVVLCHTTLVSKILLGSCFVTPVAPSFGGFSFLILG